MNLTILARIAEVLELEFQVHIKSGAAHFITLEKENKNEYSLQM